MKSIVEEASSISKAIENGWLRAGKPQEFTVRIFEEPEKNFLGLTKKPAKIGILYNEIVPAARKIQTSKKYERRSLAPKQQAQPTRSISTQRFQKQTTTGSQVDQQRQQKIQLHEEKKQERPAHWSPELIEASKQWLSSMLSIAGKPGLNLTTEAHQYNLSIRITGSVLDDKKKEQQLFKNWSYLLLQALKHKFKRGLRGYKIIILTQVSPS